MFESESSINSRSKFTVIIGFFSVLVLLGSLMTIAITRIHNNEHQINLVTDELAKVSNAFVMRDAANNRALLLYRMAQTDDPFFRDDLYMEFVSFGSTFMGSFNEINSNLDRQKDIDLFDMTKKSINKGGKTQSATATDINEGKIAKAHFDLANKIIPIQIDVREKLTQLSQSFQKNADNELVSISEQNTFSILLIYTIGFSAILLGLIITFYVTRRVTKSEMAFMQQRHLAEQANQAKTLFLATMSHEIRSPLAAIIGFCDLLRKTDLDANTTDSFIERIHRNGQHLLQIINDILDVTKIEAKQLDIEIILISPFTILDEFSGAAVISAKEKGLTFNINYVFPLPEKINTDPVRLKQILFNLCSNAVKFTSRGCISLNVSYDKKEHQMIFDVIDTGIGLTAVQQDKIFDLFTQADSSTTRKYGGSGLGLTICRLLSQKLGGVISVESTLERGSKFTFTIDVGEISDEILIYSLTEQADKQENLDTTTVVNLCGHVLLAEDSIDNQNLIDMYVTAAGATITIANNGAEALTLCENQQFDLILMDMQMPIMDGIEATKKIRLIDSYTPIIFLTANAMKSDYEKCISSGANEFLTKPIDTIRFNQTLKKYLSCINASPKQKKQEINIESLTKNFITSIPDRISEINRLHKQQSWTELGQVTHKLKAIGTPFGFPEITTICDNINLCCRNKEFENISALVNELTVFCTTIKNTRVK